MNNDEIGPISDAPVEAGADIDAFGDLSDKATRTDLDLQLFSDHIAMRRRYARVILWAVLIQMGFLDIFVGHAIFFQGNDDTKLAISAASILTEIVALALVVTKSLFPAREIGLDDAFTSLQRLLEKSDASAK